MTRPLLEARQAGRILHGEVTTTLVNDISLQVMPGEFVAITGPSGSGKSSLLYLLGLLDIPTEGDVFVGGKATKALDENQRADLRLATLGFVFQFHFLLPEFSALQNVLLPMRALGRRDDTQKLSRAHELLTTLGLADHLWKRPDQLSGGQRQRVAIARALANEPSVILADEPTGNLDGANAAQVFELMLELNRERGTSLVIVTHDERLAARMDRVLRLADGKLHEERASDV